MKEDKSWIDFLNLLLSGLVDWNIMYLFVLGLISYISEFNILGVLGGGYNGGFFFNFDGIMFGLEVCFDYVNWWFI